VVVDINGHPDLQTSVLSIFFSVGSSKRYVECRLTFGEFIVNPTSNSV
jgi:hypothetical protein